VSPARWLVIAVAALTLAAAAPAAGTPPTVTAEYVTMPDGTRIAVDVWRPAGLPPGTRAPTLVDVGRSRRSLEHADGVEQDPNFAYASATADAGYAYVFADARGTGASFGTLDAELGATMIRDYGDPGSSSNGASREPAVALRRGARHGPKMPRALFCGDRGTSLHARVGRILVRAVAPPRLSVTLLRCRTKRAARPGELNTQRRLTVSLSLALADAHRAVPGSDEPGWSRPIADQTWAESFAGLSW
jgi:X-Pro dipeptidyl-peptidase (S15 family)